MIGRWVMTPVTIMGRNGTSIAAAPVPVLAVDRVECMESARRCTPREDPRISRCWASALPAAAIIRRRAGRPKNQFYVATVNGAKAQHLRSGYLVTRSGVFVGLTAANTQGGFAYVKLARAEARLGGDPGLRLGQCRHSSRLRHPAHGYRRDRHVTDRPRDPGAGRNAHE